MPYPVKEVWPPETPFENAVQSFRVQVNQKHRYPYSPSQHFDAIRQNGRRPLRKLSARTVADVLADFSENNVILYVRSDKDNHFEYRLRPARDPKALFHNEPIPPPRYVEHCDAPPPPKERSYRTVPTLRMAGTGRQIVPAAGKPETIAPSVFVPWSETRAVRYAASPGEITL
ncbi:hypothetical protein BD311DRAFT_779648 [Dichomitus squalens]|uniref:Uncharacterized protein n=1 Tax=Dichomitus squalens TaxID=114155 RepID=A0A4Q9MK27_9APHY|nr:hypothetical protein BD311DRAFT_779648 [Dichomitus squalens]